MQIHQGLWLTSHFLAFLLAEGRAVPRSGGSQSSKELGLSRPGRSQSSKEFGSLQQLAPSSQLALIEKLSERLSKAEAELAKVENRNSPDYEYQVGESPKKFAKELDKTVRDERQDSGRKKVKYPVINLLHKQLKKVFGDHKDLWYHDWKLWVGTLCWLSVWVRLLTADTKVKREEDVDFVTRLMFTFGINIVVLHCLQYASSVPRGLMMCAAMLVGQALFQSAVWWPIEGDLGEEFDCETVYMDMNVPAIQIFVLFLGQISVWWFYFTSITANFNLSEVNYFFWLVAFIVMQLTMIFNRGDDSVLGNSFPIHEWWGMVKRANEIRFEEELDDPKNGAGELISIGRANLMMRGVLGFFCNTVLREIMAYTIPLMLMVSLSPWTLWSIASVSTLFALWMT
jgi:hypothetical protein